MAGGSSSRKEGGSLDNARLRQCHQRYRHHRPPSNIAQESPHSECFKRRQKIEYERTYLQSIQTLQRDILRIFTKCRHSDFYIIHGCNVVKTNDCIVRTRSPQLYKTLETYFVHSNNIIKCYIETPEIFQRIKDFSRLLYSNLDVEHEERILIEFIATVKHNFEREGGSCTDYTYYPKERTCEDILYSNFDLVDRTIAKKEDGADDLSPSTSDMADSGLETGSVSPLENTESENSGTDLEESHATEYVSMDDDFIKISLNGEVEKSRDKKSIAISSCSPSTSEDRHNGKQEYEDSIKSGVTRIPRNSRDIEATAGCSSHLKPEQRDSNAYHGCTGMAETTRESKDGEETTSRSNEKSDKVSRYEAIYDESDGGSNDNEQTNSFVPTESFEFVDPTIMSPTTSDPRRNANHYDSFNKIADEKLCPNPEARSMTVEELRHELSHSNDPTLKKSSSSISSYYFIDASSLNDEEEMASLGNLMSKEIRDSRGNLTIYTSTTGNYVPTRTACNAMQDEQNHKLTTRKLSSLQGGHERVAEFERELKMTEYLKPMTESRKVKRVDSISEDKSETGSDKGIEKEALVVEIKEADSGESTHPSPCSDNNTNVKETNVVSKDVTNVDKSANVREIDDPARRPSLIRRNTFELDPNDEKLSVLRQEYERRQGHLLFQSSIPQYSGHRVDGDSCFEPPNEKSSAPIVAEVITQFSVDLPQTGVTYSTITYMTTSDHHHPDIPKTLITTDQEVSVKNDITSTKFATTSLLLLADPKEQSKVKNAELPISIASRKNETNFTTGQFLSSRESPEEMISWASEKDSSARSITNEHDDYPMSKSSSSKLLIDSCSESEDGSRNCCNSLPVTLNCELPRERRLSLSSTKRPKRDETAPIISGGMCTVDYSKPTDSPIVHRKTESTPIVSGGSVMMMTEPRERIKPTRMASSMTAWVVDMSDCGKNGTGNRSSNIGNCQTAMSQSFSSSDCVNGKNGRKAKASETKCSSLGFFVNLKDIDTPKEKHENPCQEVKKPVIVEPAKQACEFFVDMSNENKTEKNDNVEVSMGNCKVRNLGENGDRKNIFSMFIDLKESNDKQQEETRVSGSRLFDKRGDARQPNKLQGVDSESSSSSQIEQSGQDHTSNGSSGERGKPSVFMFIESDSPVVRRRALSSSRPAFQRHSWNVEKTQLQGNGNGQLTKDSVVRREHKRAHSVSVDRADLRKLQTKSSNSSHSLSEVARADTLNGTTPRKYNEQESSRNTDTSTEEVFEYDVRDTPPNSHVETGENEDIRGCIKQRDYKEPGTVELPTTTEISDTRIYEDECSEVSGWDKTRTESTEGHTRKSETFDISSGSGPSPESDNHDFDLDDLRTGEMANYNEILQVEHPVTSKVSETHKSLTETIKKIECELKKPEYSEYERTSSDSLTPVSRKDTKSSSRGSKEGQTKAAGSSFVRLSDLDKTPSRSRASDVASREDRTIYRMSNSIPETSWVESKLAVNRANGPIRALPRKFGAIMSTSLPAKHKSPIEDAEGEGEGVISESDLSSMQSSMGRSGGDVSTEETETSSMGVTKPYNRLGEDLLRMFLEEINPDVTIDVAGRRIQAHKCILSSRCQYFAAILSGGWIESAGNVISLQGYSYNAVHFALCHIYSGESNIPDTLSIVELATLADMLCLEGLKEVIGYTLKVKYCHLFHKPCQLCAVGVLECMPLAAAYGLDEVYRKSLRWITRHFVRIWPCKAFATLPRELMDKCYHQHIVHMSPDNVLQTMMDCDKLLATLPNVRWAEPIFRMVSNLLETAVKYISENFSSVLGNENFQALGRDLTWNISRLEDNFLAAADRLPPDQACKSYSKLNKMLAATQVEEPQAKPPWGPLFIEFLRKIQSRVEKCLVKEASRAARTTTWLKMDLELRRRIQELACLVILPHEALKRPSRHSNFLKEPRVPSARTPASRSLDLRRVKMAITEHDKTTKSVTTVTTTTSAPSTTQQIKKPLLVKPKSDPLERKIPQEEKQVTTDSVALRPKSWPNKLEVKSRYLEPRNKSVTKETAQQAQHERVIVQQRRKIMISSSDSSRTSSPAMKRAVDKKPLAKMKLTIKKDVKALSSDSLAEPTSSRVTTKKDTISKSCGITRPESPSLKQKDADIGLSADSLAEPKRKQQQPITKKKQPGKMDTSMSADSLMAEIGTAPKSSNVSNKVSPTMGRVGTTSKTQIYDRVKKSSPPMPQKSPLTVGRKLPRSLECSTAASRNRAAAISAYHGSPNLRRNLLDAAKTPDVPAKTLNGVSSKSSPRQQSLSSSVVSAASSIAKKEKREPLSNQPSTESPSKRSSPKSNGTHRTNRLTSTVAKRPVKGIEDRAKTKCHNGDAPKQPTVGSRSGTFLKDEPTILKKSDIKTVQISDS